MAQPLRLSFRALECFGLFVVFPWWVDIKKYSGLLIPFLVVSAILCFAYLLTDKSFDRTRLWNAASFKKHFPRIMLTWLLGIGVMIGATIWLDAQPWVADEVTLFGFVARAPAVWAVIIVLYPLFSVYPQEIILRTFFFQRYKILFQHPAAMIIANGLVFAWVHIIFQNWVAVALCVPGGMLFAYTYWKSQSTITSGFEHALFGNAMWTIGLGWFFYGGAVQ